MTIIEKLFKHKNRAIIYSALSISYMYSGVIFPPVDAALVLLFALSTTATYSPESCFFQLCIIIVASSLFENEIS